MNILRAIFIISISLFFTACEQQSTKVLRVGICPWPGYEPLALASTKGFYENTSVRIIRFATPTESYRALRDGIIDVAAFTADEVFHYAEVRDKPRIFLILDISNGADALVAKKEIKTIADLKGMRLGVDGSALGDYLVQRVLDFSKQGLLSSEITLKNVEINVQEQAFINDEIDAAVTFEPSKSLLIKAGAHVLFDSSQIPYEIVDVLVTNEKTIKERHQDLENLSKGWFKALKYINKNYEKSMKMMAQQEATSVKEFQKGYEDLILPTQEENLNMLGKKASLLAPMIKLSKLMYEKGSLQKHIDVKPLLDSRIINAIKE